MKRFSIVILILFIVTACNTSTLSISEIEHVPEEVQDKINSEYTLQLIHEGEDASYIVYQSSGTVTVDLETVGNTLSVKLDETDNQNEKQMVFKLTLDPEHEVIDVLINGESTPFDDVTSI